MTYKQHAKILQIRDALRFTSTCVRISRIRVGAVLLREHHWLRVRSPFRGTLIYINSHFIYSIPIKIRVWVCNNLEESEERMGQLCRVCERKADPENCENAIEIVGCTKSTRC